MPKVESNGSRFVARDVRVNSDGGTVAQYNGAAAVDGTVMLLLSDRHPPGKR